MRRKRPTVAEQIRLGAYFFTTGAIDLAIAQLTAATKRAPHSATAWMNLGAAYLENIVVLKLSATTAYMET